MFYKSAFIIFFSLYISQLKIKLKPNKWRRLQKKGEKRVKHPEETSPVGESGPKKSRVEEAHTFLKQRKGERISEFLLRIQFFPAISQLHFDEKGEHKDQPKDSVEPYEPAFEVKDFG